MLVNGIKFSEVVDVLDVIDVHDKEVEVIGYDNDGIYNTSDNVYAEESAYEDATKVDNNSYYKNYFAEK